MRCERAQELFSDYCEGVIPAALKVPFESHLRACAECSRGVAELRATWSILDSEPRIEAPHGFRAAVLERIDSAESERASQSWLKRIANSFRSTTVQQRLAWGGAAVLLLVVGSFAIPGQYNPASWMRIRFSGTSQFIASQPTLHSDSGTLTARIPLVLAGVDGKVQNNDSVQVKVRVIAGPVNLVGSDTVTLSGTSPAIVNLRVVGAITSESVILEVSRLDGKEPLTQQLMIPLPRE
jgi:hypothetical protein